MNERTDKIKQTNEKKRKETHLKNQMLKNAKDLKKEELYEMNEQTDKIKQTNEKKRKATHLKNQMPKNAKDLKKEES